MKIRIRGNSLRLRLTQSEVRQFATAGMVQESTHFSPQTMFEYRLKVSNTDCISAAFEGNCMTVFIPAKMAQEWAESDQVGMEIEQKISEQKTLYILIEKDFQCLEPRGAAEDQDSFPNPKLKLKDEK